jgi:hypothetical protein
LVFVPKATLSSAATTEEEEKKNEESKVNTQTPTKEEKEGDI